MSVRPELQAATSIPRPSLLGRLRRKVAAIRRCTALGLGAGDERELFILALLRNRVPGAGLAARLMAGSAGVIAPRLTLSGGQRVRVEFRNPGQLDTFEEIFLDRIYDLSVVGFQPERVADCGGYCGYFSAMASGVFRNATVTCFEANPDNLRPIEAQLALLDHRVELVAAAVHVREGTVPFSGSGVGGGIVRGEAEGQARRVPCIDFPAWLKARAPASLVLKIDIEGAEVELLPALLGWVPAPTVIFLETHHPDETCGALLGPYREAGFTVTEVRRRVAPGAGFDYVEWNLVRNP